jgi:5-hydroxyisourate hydrolase-like protein (transthyretin family)
VVEGQVLNATAGAVPIAGVPVTLWAIADQEQSVVQRVTTGAEGQFRIQVEDAQAYSYQVQATFEGVSYWSQALTFAADRSLLSLPVTVYETTASEADLFVERAHWILDARSGSIQVQELLFITNGGTRTYVGSGGESAETLQFIVPVDAIELQLTEALMACCIVETAHGFAYTRPVLPGTREFFFSYQLTYPSSSYTLSKPLPYPVRHLDVFFRDNGVGVTGAGLTTAEPVVLQDQTYLHLSAEHLSRNQTLVLSLTSLPVGTPADTSRRALSATMVRAVIGVGTLVVILALTYPLLRRPAGEAS